MPVLRYLDLSTSHLTEAECDELGGVYIMGDLDQSPRVVSHDYGAWVNVPDVDSAPEWAPGGKAEEALKASRPNLAACIVRARELDCTWINFDQAANNDETLPTLDW